LGILKAFYKDVRNLMREQKPNLKFVFHDAFHFSADTWNDLFDDDDHENVVMDTHQYFAWWGAQDDIGNYCDGYGGTFNEAAKIKYDIWVGEWSLATDVCPCGSEVSTTPTPLLPVPVSVSPAQPLTCPLKELTSTALLPSSAPTVPLAPHGITHTS